MSRGRTVITMATPETTDDEDRGTSRQMGDAGGSLRPFLSRFAVEVDGEVAGRTRITEAAPETTDEASPGHSLAVPQSTGGRTVITRVSAETTDDEPRA